MARPSSRPGTNKEFRSLIFPNGMNVAGEIKLKEIDTPSERTHRHKMEVRRFWFEGAPVHLAAIAIAVCVMGSAVVVAFRPASSVDDVKWSYSILSDLLIGVAGFAFGKAAN